MFQSAQNSNIVLYGEVLYDVFVGDSEVLGGATFNVAWNLKGFGLNPLLVSRVGADRRGDDIKQAMSEWGMDLSGIQTDPDRSTGIVEVHLNETGHTFDIVKDVAYDFIDSELAIKIIGEYPQPILYHGTLAMRTPSSMEGLYKSITECSCKGLFVDLNLRAPWWSIENVILAIQNARWLKLNDEEMIEIAKLQNDDASSLEKLMQHWLERYSLEGLLVTRAEKGALYLDKDQKLINVSAGKIESMADTVGAGDAFSAVYLLGLIKDWPKETTLQRASEFASSVCSLRGAVSQDPAFYQSWLDRWN